MPFVGSLNKVIIIGNIANDPLLSYTQQTNTPICKFTIATNRKFKTQAGEYKEEAAFHRIVVWGPRAENLSKILAKGTKVYVEGRIVYNMREAEGRTYKEAYIRASDIIILSRKRSDSSAGEQSHDQVSADHSAETEDAVLNLEKIAADLGQDESKSKPEDKGKEETKAEAQEDQADDLPF